MNYNYINLPPFKWFVLQNFPFIEADFDAITNWQLFCKLGEEINKIINSNNLTGQQVENLTNAFNDLQEYVNNYFNNLDIQTEVDNKLDEMAQSGELAELISQYLESQAIIGFNNISSLKATTSLADGSFARTYGRNTYNDGYGAFYKIRERVNADVPDDYNIVVLTNTVNLVAERIISQTEKDVTRMQNKKVIMIGDSYANRENSWQDRIKTDMGFTNDTCNMKRVSGTGFCNTVDNQNFRTMLTDNITLNPLEVTDIIVCGGYNDISYSYNQIMEAMTNFFNTCKTTYPNATVYIGMIGWAKPPITNYATITGNLQVTRNNYMEGCRLYEKAHYLNNVEYAMHNADAIDDTYFHPNSYGQFELATAIMESWKTGMCNITKNSLNVTEGFTPATNITLSSNDSIYSEIENNLSRLMARTSLQFFFDSSTLYNTNSTITLGTLTKGYVFGKNGIIKSSVMCLVNTRNNGYFWVPAIFKIDEGVVKLELHILNRQGNNWLGEDTLNYIIIYGLNLWCDSMEQY